MWAVESHAFSIRWCSTDDVGIKYSYENKENEFKLAIYRQSSIQSDIQSVTLDVTLNEAKREVSATFLFRLMAQGPIYAF